MPESTGKIRLQSAGLSDVGRKRQQNEDSFALAPQHNLFVVADGMGGHAAGEVASRLAVESIQRHIATTDPRKQPTVPASHRPAGEDAARPAPARQVIQAIRLANQEIARSVRKDASRRGMGTTVVLAYVQAGRAYIGSVGDSRAYLIRGGAMRQLTTDHTFVGEQVRSGALTAAEARTHPARNILTRAVGSQEDVEPDVVEHELKNGDRLLLCSDGLTTMAEDDAILAALRAHDGDLEASCRALVDLANTNGGDDNVTVVLVHALSG